MTGQESFNIDSNIANLGDLLARRLPPDELNFFAELCDAGRVRWEEIAVKAIAEHAKKMLRRLTTAIEIRDRRELITGKARVIATVVLMTEDLNFLELPDYLEVTTIPMTDEIFNGIEIKTTEEIEKILVEEGIITKSVATQ
jgi:hypothetical protein